MLAVAAVNWSVIESGAVRSGGAVTIARDAGASADLSGTQGAPRATEWIKDDKDGRAGRIVSLPADMTIAEGQRVLGGYSRMNWSADCRGMLT